MNAEISDTSSIVRACLRVWHESAEMDPGFACLEIRFFSPYDGRSVGTGKLVLTMQAVDAIRAALDDPKEPRFDGLPYHIDIDPVKIEIVSDGAPA